MTRSSSSHTAHKNHKAHSRSTDRLVPTLADTETSADLIPPKQRKREHWLHVIFFVLLTIFDIFIVWLTRHEWNLQKRQRALKEAAEAAASDPASAGRPDKPAD